MLQCCLNLVKTMTGWDGKTYDADVVLAVGDRGCVRQTLIYPWLIFFSNNVGKPESVYNSDKLQKANHNPKTCLKNKKKYPVQFWNHILSTYTYQIDGRESYKDEQLMIQSISHHFSKTVEAMLWLWRIWLPLEMIFIDDLTADITSRISLWKELC